MKFKKGYIPWNKGKIGVQVAWNKGLKGKEYTHHYSKGFPTPWLGKKFSEEHRNKIGKKSLGHPVTDENIAKLIQRNKNRIWTDESRKKYGESRKGHIASEIARNKTSASMKEAYKIGKIKSHFKGRTGNKSYVWKGGISLLPYDMGFNNKFKELIKLRDNNCLVCGENNNLDIHHIDYNKLNTNKDNCCCLCSSCHSKTNFNREHWTQFFQSLLKNKYNYNYDIKLMELI